MSAAQPHERMPRSLVYIDAALADLPATKAGTPLARDIAAIRENLLRAKARLRTLQGKGA